MLSDYRIAYFLVIIFILALGTAIIPPAVSTKFTCRPFLANDLIRGLYFVAEGKILQEKENSERSGRCLWCTFTIQRIRISHSKVAIDTLEVV